MKSSLLLAAGLALASLAPPLAADVLPAAVDGEALPSLAPMLERVTPAVVNVSSKARVKVRDPFGNDPFFRHFFGLPNMPRERVQSSLGSGVVVDAARGYILTNNHVIDGADEIEVTLNDGRTLKAEKIGADKDSDVAVIKVAPQGLRAVPMADSTKLRVGDFVVAVGNPFGLGQSVTTGIVSGLGRTNLTGFGVQNFIQTDAAINPGNSGGALVNLRGELVGINTMIFSPSGGNVGIGYAVPSALASDVMRQLLAHGEVKRGNLGIETQALDAEIAALLDTNAPRGAVVVRVRDGSPAAQAGIEPGDVVVALDGRPIAGPRELSNAEALLPVGTRVRLSLVRGHVAREVTAELKASVLRKADAAAIDPRLAGATLTDLSDEIRRRGYRGVMIASVASGSRAAKNGLAAGDIIGEVNREDVDELASLEAALKLRPEQLMLTIARNGRAYYALVE
ncbi:MAG TPA: Do family serine endopeptidase [Candidatus Saccharimonadia bacterium]|nr:Do family serine endopeptidase [Candidatus Saccharimonadia bacterium]